MNQSELLVGEWADEAIEEGQHLGRAAEQFGGATDIAYYDVAAAIYAVRPNLGEAESALVKVVTEESLARGQTIVGLTMADRITMIAGQAELDYLVYQFYTDPTFDLFAAMFGILMREPDNASVVLDINERWMSLVFLAGIR